MTAAKFNYCLERIRCGDSSSLCIIFNEYYNYMIYTSLALINDKGAAEDIASDFLQYILTDINKLPYISNPKAWIITCIKNRTKDYIKSSSNTMPIEYINEIAAVSDTAHQATLHYEIIRAILSLSDDQRELFVLRFVYGYKYKEIARIIEAPIGTIKRQLYDIRTQLSHLEKYL